MTARLNQPWLIGLIAAFAHAAAAFVYWQRSGRDLSAFVLAGDEYCAAAATPANLHVYPDASGYDGQFYYRLALDPFTRTRTDRGIRFDNPAYRQQRILYPLLVWLLSLGHATAVPLLMVLVNIAAAAALGWLMATWVRDNGAHVVWSMTVILYPGLLVSVSRDLVEPVELALLAGALVALQRRRWVVTAVVLALAALTRETALLVPAALLLTWRPGAARSGGLTPPLFVAAAPLAIGCVWQALMRLNWGEIPLLASGGNLAAPGSGLAALIRMVVTEHGELIGRFRAGLIFLAVFVACVLFAWRTSAAPKTLRLAWALYAALALSLGRAVWSEDFAFLRAVAEFFVLGSALLAVSRSHGRIIMLAYTALAWLAFVRTALH